MKGILARAAYLSRGSYDTFFPGETDKSSSIDKIRQGHGRAS